MGLKLGTYGFIRFSFPLFPEACFYFTPFVYAMSVVGIIYTSFTAIRQTDFKRIIAYTSVAHMNLFLLIGVVYDRHHTRMVKYYGGLVHVMPIYITIFLFFTMANIGLPGTGSFIGEFLILTGSFKANTTITFFSAT